MTPTATVEPATRKATEVRDWVRRHRVCWERLPLYEMVRGRRMRVGFELLLFAQGARPGAAGRDETSPRGADLFLRLRQIARLALPPGPRPARFELGPYDWSRHLRPEAEWAPEVQLPVRIIHRTGTPGPPDVGDERAIDEIETKLRALGVRRRSWSRRAK